MKKTNMILALTLALGTAFSAGSMFGNGDVQVAKADPATAITQNVHKKQEKMTFVLIYGAWADAFYYRGSSAAYFHE